jgi:hypothetical protein
MLRVARIDAALCAPCVTRLGELLLHHGHAGLGHLRPSTPARERHLTTEGSLRAPDLGTLLAEFPRGVEMAIRPDDAQAHLDLAHAYDEMGLAEDAFHEYGTALSARGAKDAVLVRALDSFLARAHPDVLAVLAAALRVPPS